MKANPPSLFLTGRFPVSLFEERVVGMDDYGDAVAEAVRLPGNAVFVTDETLAAARAYVAANPGGRGLDLEKDVEMGDLLAVVRDGDQNRPMSRHAIGETADFVVTLTIDGEPKDFSLHDMGLLVVREAILEKAQSGTALDPIDRNVLDGVDHILNTVATEPDPERFPRGLMMVALQAKITDTYRNAELPVPAEDMARKVRSDALRAAIGRAEPGHDAALTTGRGLDDFLRAAAVSAPRAVGAEVRPQTYDDPRLRRMITSNDRLCREVFGALTKTRIENLGVAMCSKEDVDRIVGMAGEDQALSGDWVTEARTRLQRITQAVMPGYRCETAFVSQGGTDLLAVKDMAGGYLYSWPTADRQPVMEIGRGHVATISPEEVPTVEELAQLEQICEQVMNRHYAANMMADDEELGFDEEFEDEGDVVEGEGFNALRRDEPAAGELPAIEAPRDEMDDLLDDINNLPELRPNRLH